MSRWTAEEISREAARLIQSRIGQNYQSKQLHEWLQQEWESVWNGYDYRETLRTDSLTLAEDADSFVLPSKYSKLVGTYNDSQESVWWPLWGVETEAKQQLQRLFEGGRNASYRQVGTGIYSATWVGNQAVLAQPTTAETLKLVSSATGDTGLYVRIVGEDTNGVPIYENLATHASNATTATTSTNSYKRIDVITTGATTKTGRFTITGTTSGTTYAVIEPWSTKTSYSKYQLAAAATESTTVYYVAKLRWRPFLDEIDAPPMDFVDMVLVYGVCEAAMLEKRQTELAQYYNGLKQAALGKAKMNASNMQPAKLRFQRW